MACAICWETYWSPLAPPPGYNLWRTQPKQSAWVREKSIQINWSHREGLFFDQSPSDFSGLVHLFGWRKKKTKDKSPMCETSLKVSLVHLCFFYAVEPPWFFVLGHWCVSWGKLDILYLLDDHVGNQDKIAYLVFAHQPQSAGDYFYGFCFFFCWSSSSPRLFRWRSLSLEMCLMTWSWSFLQISFDVWWFSKWEIIGALNLRIDFRFRGVILFWFRNASLFPEDTKVEDGFFFLSSQAISRLFVYWERSRNWNTKEDAMGEWRRTLQCWGPVE